MRVKHWKIERRRLSQQSHTRRGGVDAINGRGDDDGGSLEKVDDGRASGELNEAGVTWDGKRGDCSTKQVKAVAGSLVRD